MCTTRHHSPYQDPSGSKHGRCSVDAHNTEHLVACMAQPYGSTLHTLSFPRRCCANDTLLNARQAQQHTCHCNRWVSVTRWFDCPISLHHAIHSIRGNGNNGGRSQLLNHTNHACVAPCICERSGLIGGFPTNTLHTMQSQEQSRSSATHTLAAGAKADCRLQVA
jgi:hypothetical protein